jgi:predicted DNA-binding transcriptional regulator AlpA
VEARYLSPTNVVTYLQLPSLKALYGLVARKQIPYIRLGNRTLRFDRVALELWLSHRSVKVKEVRHGRTSDAAA